MRRKRIFCFPVCFLLVSLLLAVPALADLSLDRREVETYDPYTLGDLAAARFAVYGLLPDAYRTPQKDTAKPLSRLDAVTLLRDAFGHPDTDIMNIPFRDVDEEHREAVSWAYSSGIVKGYSATEFGTYHVTEQAFLTMLLNALGFQRKFTYAEAFDFAESVGLSRPLGISDTFSLGDAMLYLQEVLQMTTPNGKPMRQKLNIPADVLEMSGYKQVTFPAVVALYPASIEDAVAQIELATHYLTFRSGYKGPLCAVFRRRCGQKFVVRQSDYGGISVRRFLGTALTVRTDGRADCGIRRGCGRFGTAARFRGIIQ